MSADRTWLILQLTDSAFPIGSLAHAGGLEAAWQMGEIEGREDLCAFIAATQLQIATSAAPILTAVLRSPARFAELDQLFDAMLVNHVANRASRTQGQAFLATATRVFQRPALDALQQSVRDDKLPCHLPAAFGAVYACLELDVELAVSHFLFLNLRGLISAAVRLGIVGTIEGQSIVFELSPRAPQWIQTARSISDPKFAAQSSPLIDFYQAYQDQLYSRLFVS
ncbi:urease accessory UreF family protein [soil metagenome]